MYDDSDWPDEPEDIIRAAFGADGPGCLQLKSDVKARILQDQADFYHLIDRKMKLNYCSVLDRLSLYIQKAMANAINGPLKLINTSSVIAIWKGLKEEVDEELLNEYFMDLHNECLNQFNKYHKTQKGASDQTLARINEEGAIEDFLKLGDAFKIIFGQHEDLFLTQDLFTPYKITGYVPSIRGDEEAGALIEKYEELKLRGCAVSRRNLLLEIEYRYWEIGDREKFHDILGNGIQYAKEERRTEDHLVLTRRYADRLEEIEDWGGAITQLDRALETTLVFGMDRRYARIKHQLIRCKINRNTAGDVKKFGSNWYVDLEECHEISGAVYGDRILELDVLSTMVSLRVKQGEVDDAIQTIECGRRTILDYLHPRGKANFLFCCAKSLLECEASTDDLGLNVSEYGKKLLDEAKAIQEKCGEKSDLKKSLELQCEHEQNQYTADGIRDEIRKLNSEIKAVLAWVDLDEIEEDFIQHLVNTGFWEGVRLLLGHDRPKFGHRQASRKLHRNPSWTEQEFGIKAKDIFPYDGLFGTFWRHRDNAQKLLHSNRRDDALNCISLAEEILTRIEEDYSLQELTPPMFTRMLLLEVEVDCYKGTEKINKIEELIEGWGRLQSNRGVYRWKNRLAKILYQEGLEGNIKQIQEAQDLYDEVLEFYKERDAANYFYFSCDRILVGHMNDAVNSIEEWGELLNDPHIPDTNHIRIELYSRYAYQLKREGNLEDALKIIRMGVELILETGNIDEERYRVYSGSLKTELRLLIELGRYQEAEEKIDKIVDEGWLNQSAELQLRIEILRSKNEWGEAIELLRTKFQHDKNKGQWKLASITLSVIVEILEEQDLLDEAIPILKEKIEYDRHYGEGAGALKSQSITIGQIASYHENKQQWAEAIEARWEQFKINKLQKLYEQKYYSLNKIRHLLYKTQDQHEARIILWRMFHLSELECKDENSSVRDGARNNSKYALDTITQSMFADNALRYMGGSFFKLSKLWVALHFDNEPKEERISDMYKHLVEIMKEHRPNIDPKEMIEVLFAWYNHSHSYPYLHEHALAAADLITKLRPKQGQFLHRQVEVMMAANTLDEEE